MTKTKRKSIAPPGMDDEDEEEQVETKTAIVSPQGKPDPRMHHTSTSSNQPPTLPTAKAHLKLI